MILESPDFTVAEDGSALVRLDRQFEPGGLVALAPEAAYTVDLVDREAELRTLVRRGDASSAGLRGRRVLVRVRCPRRAGRACRITAQGMIRKRVGVTQRRTTKVARGRSRLLSLRVKRRFRERVAKRKRLLVVQKVRVGKVTATYARSRALIRR